MILLSYNDVILYSCNPIMLMSYLNKSSQSLIQDSAIHLPCM